eukprot:CAMPEP_0184296858 /NCGR_PEP_ID=MMETSP1049-20130417/7812_1 /TAXON_ID=77928 /ORGANISM="Proteomonas sulcata, Strain CCMP704" /LENGTH=48 /DNA_ID= /DNA_START= /DNA_END= /DNA_ORIENTATION=
MVGDTALAAEVGEVSFLLTPFPTEGSAFCPIPSANPEKLSTIFMKPFS